MRLPPNTFAVGIDDSRMQRVMRGHIFSALDVPKARSVLLGSSTEELEEIPQPHRADCYFLVICDENLDIVENNTVRTLSGSAHLHELRASLSDGDVDAYLLCAHGFLGKMFTGKKAPRVGTSSLHDINKEDLELDLELALSSNHTMDAHLEPFVAAEMRATLEWLELEGWVERPWAKTWVRLHQLKGEMLSLAPRADNTAAGQMALRSRIIGVIEKLRDQPVKFEGIWPALRLDLAAFLQQ
ncbi:hypothetical protein T492DRAFT_886699 [Pavlovales sp. CCMP2436]|nr:hypothetical protein T492DRAFT_886699 [Pavlovales sp. CCMP2436]